MNLTAAMKRMPAGQQRAGKLLIGFFALMLVLTLLSRGLDSFSIPTVSTVSVGAGTINRKITISGTVEALGQTSVPVPSGFMISSLLVDEGSRVEEGELLAVMDLSSLEEKLEDARREVQIARLNAQVRALEAQKVPTNPVEDAERTLERAKEDLKATKEENNIAIRRAEKAVSDARKTRKETRDNDGTDEELAAHDADITQLLWTLNDEQRRAERAELTAQRTIEDAELALEKAKLEAAADQSKDQIDLQQKSLENQVAALEMQSKEKELAKLEELMESDGRITSPVSGTVTKVNTRAGESTSGDNLLLLSDAAQGSVFRGTVDEENGDYLDRGDIGQLSIPGQRESLAVEIGSLTAPTEKGGDYTMSIFLPGAALEPGTSTTLVVEKSSKNYAQVIPIAALHANNNSKTSGYVYVLREKNTALGVQNVVEQVPVEIHEKNAQSAAINGVFGPEDKIISASSRSLTSGDRVRLS